MTGEMVYKDLKTREDMELSDKLHALLTDAIAKLIIVKRILNDDDTVELSYHELSGVTMAVNEAYSLLEMANKLYFEEGKNEGKEKRITLRSF